MRKLIKKTLLVILAIVVAIQIPFIYRRYEIGQMADKIARANASRTVREDPKFKEYKGIIHAHTNLGGHSTGSFDELIAAANSNDLDFVLMTEHWADEYDTSALTLNGVYGKTLFVGGNEIDTSDGDRFLMIPGSADAAGLRKMPTTAVIEKLHAENRLALITYPEKFKSWDSDFDGDEVFSLHTNAVKMNPFTTLFDLIWSYPKYPALMMATYFRRPDDNLAKFDEIAAKRPISLFAGTDAHSNIGFHLFGDDAGHKIVNIKLDPYATTFQLVRAHVLIPNDRPLTREGVIEAIKAGRYFVGLDVIGDTSGFEFWAETAQGNEYMGSELSLGHSLDLKSACPVPARILLLKNGVEVARSEHSHEIAYTPTAPGTYRVEVYRDDLGPPFDKMPWIISNPIYVR
ncbi:MAG: hypothetical protein ACRD43_15155 [Pyrinomonadaceae bacterium]